MSAQIRQISASTLRDLETQIAHAALAFTRAFDEFKLCDASNAMDAWDEVSDARTNLMRKCRGYMHMVDRT